jgi:hypothetical protein
MGECCAVRFLMLVAASMVLSASAFARLGTVRTASGSILEGRIRITPERVDVVNAARGLIHSVELTNLARLTYPKPKPVPLTDADLAQLAAEWREEDIGPIFTTGSTRFEPGIFTVRSSGLNIDGAADSFHYVYKELRGDGEIVAEVVSVQYTHPNAKAGLMFREHLGEYARHVTLALTSMRGAVLQMRGADRGPTEILSWPGLFAPCWLKLKRRDNEFSAYVSRNGRTWSLVERVSMTMAKELYVGLAVTSARAGMLNWSTFGKVQAGRRVMRDDFTPRVELVSGSVLTGRPIRIDGEEVVFAGAARVVQIPTARVARIVFQPLFGDLGWKTRSSRPGVWVSNGDFFDGEFRQLDEHRLIISSVLYGLREFDVDDEVLALVLRPRRAGRAQFEIELLDGTFLIGSDLALGEGELRFREAALGALRIPAFEILEMRRR